MREVSGGNSYLPLLAPNGPTDEAGDLAQLVITPNTDGTTTDLPINFIPDSEPLLSRTQSPPDLSRTGEYLPLFRE